MTVIGQDTSQQQMGSEILPVSVIVASTYGGSFKFDWATETFTAEGVSRGKALNAAAKQARAEFLLFLRIGVEVDYAAVKLLVEDLQRDLSIAAVGPRLLAAAGPVPNEYVVIEDECRRHPLDIHERVSPAPKATEYRMPPGDVIALKMDALLVRTVAFWGIGGFDEHRETALDLNLGLALKSHHWRCVFEPAASAFVSSQEPVSLSILDLQLMTQEWYGKFMPHGHRSSDGVMRPHPWWILHGEPNYQGIWKGFEPKACQSYRTEERYIPGERCSVVVVTYNSCSTLDDCLTSVLQNLGTFDELIVVDNASQDGTRTALKQMDGKDHRLRLIFNDQNLGFSEACNVGIRASEGEYIVLLNPDTVVAEGWLARMRQYFTDSKVGAVGPISDYVAGLQKHSIHLPLGVSPEIKPQEIYDFACRVNTRRGVESKMLIGFCMMVRKSALEEVGLLDPELFLGCDDWDLSWRLRLAGYKLAIATDVFVHHDGQVSFKTEPEGRTQRRVQEAMDHMAKKLVRHYGKGKVPSSLELWGIAGFHPDPEILSSAA